MKIGRIEISAGAMMAVALLYYLDDSGVTLLVLLAGAVHETGWKSVSAAVFVCRGGALPFGGTSAFGGRDDIGGFGGAGGKFGDSLA